MLIINGLYHSYYFCGFHVMCCKYDIHRQLGCVLQYGDVFMVIN